MKSPEYVAIVTGIYRKYLDLYKEKGNYTVEDKDMEALLQIFNRGGFTEGYLFSNYAFYVKNFTRFKDSSKG
jgi:putative protease